jgi:hypothetical protein
VLDWANAGNDCARIRAPIAALASKRAFAFILCICSDLGRAIAS